MWCAGAARRALPDEMMIAHPPPAYPGMRVGLQGGSFNPVHAAHRQLAIVALERLQLDQVWWIVAPDNPLKSSATLAPLPERLEAARRAAAHPRIVVTGFEAALPSNYTSETIAFLIRRYPATHFIWIGGGDLLAEFHRWYNWRRIFHQIPLAFFDRPDFRHKALASQAAIYFSSCRAPEAHAARLAVLQPPVWAYLRMRLSPLSSTGIRAKQQKHMSGAFSGKLGANFPSGNTAKQ